MQQYERRIRRMQQPTPRPDDRGRGRPPPRDRPPDQDRRDDTRRDNHALRGKDRRGESRRDKQPDPSAYQPGKNGRPVPKPGADKGKSQVYHVDDKVEVVDDRDESTSGDELSPVAGALFDYGSSDCQTRLTSIHRGRYQTSIPLASKWHQVSSPRDGIV